MFNMEAFRLWLIDRFEPEELLLYMNINTEDLVDMFPEEWEDNTALLKLYGYEGEVDDDDEEE